ncbi:TlpA disulfide reductase family protein [Aquabacterium sp. J223]|uniref:TlpA family protein disulfide reductase n=1 Tax=Aquabacterium sp. J223 TaxID=2898431 RepID=UPI0021ADB380|nr:TlpA disulfide reductase family protein [Aquabacterium sp. J223]UUX96645.1 TlpA family protein disulfide reductase [Aquabacterium sp. J223]
MKIQRRSEGRVGATTWRHRWTIVVVVVAAMAAGAVLNNLRHGPGGALIGAQRFVMLPQPKKTAPVSFVNSDGAPMQLDHLQGKVLLLNIWATWCTPCRQEMPALDRLQASLGGRDFEVVALSIDNDVKGLTKVKAFYSQVGIRHLRVFQDPTATAGFKLGTSAVPTTLLIDRRGREVGRLTGAAEWDSEEAMNLVRSTISP